MDNESDRPCPADVIDAIRAVLDYLRDDERRDYETQPRRGHVFESIARLDEWLSGDEEHADCSTRHDRQP